MVKVEYEPLPYVFDTQDALAPDAPAIWAGGNAPGGSITEGIAQPSTAVTKYGDAEGAIAAADQVVTIQLDHAVDPTP